MSKDCSNGSTGHFESSDRFGGKPTAVTYVPSSRADSAPMEADDLDSLIADSLSGVQAALDTDRKAAPADAGRSAGEAVKELKEAGKGEAQQPGEDFFKDLVKTFQDENFQKAMAEAMQQTADSKAESKPSITEAAAPASAPAAAALASAPATSAAPASAVASSADSGAEDFLQSFVKSFDQAAGSDKDLEKQLTNMMTSMLSNDLLTDSLQQIADALEPWLKTKKGLAKADRSRYEAMLRLYRSIVGVYKSNPDPLPDFARDQVQRMLAELQTLGNPPDEVMAEIVPKEVAEGGESFEDMMKNMGLDANLAGPEQDLMKKLADDPEELTRVMKEMAGGMPEEACKQQ